MKKLPEISLVKDLKASNSIVLGISEQKSLQDLGFLKEQLDYTLEQFNEENKTQVWINQFYRNTILLDVRKLLGKDHAQELARREGAKVAKLIQEYKLSSLGINIEDSKILLGFIEGLVLSLYSFSKYKTEKINYKGLKEIKLVNASIQKEEIVELVNVLDSVYTARNLVNEPQNTLTATVYSDIMKDACAETGISFTCIDKTGIERLGMGGLLAVNMGSVQKPTFNILEWKPENASNKKPIVLVGKGVVYDTGGLSLKPTANSMDFMKSDMAGSAAVFASILAMAKNKVNKHVIALVAATDNRPGKNAYAPGDVIKMYNGKTVEVMNTDAEGRLTLADALSYGDQFEPELSITMATLTGSAARAIGTFGIVGMGNASKKLSQLKKASEEVYERVVEFPFWDEYNEELKTPMADLSNLGGALGGAITAGKFLEHFVAAPFIHLDIAGPAYLHKAQTYNPVGGTGTGVRLLYHFVKNYK